MNAFFDQLEKRNGLELGAQLGTIVGENAAVPLSVPTRLSAIIQKLMQRKQIRERAEYDMRAHNFIRG
jgi:hypothetical protein